VSELRERVDPFYRSVRAIVRFWVWFFFKSVDVRHLERVPGRGPVLLCVNHPNNLIDSLLVAAMVRRKIHFLATATLFRNALVGRFLAACGAIPVYRKVDDPDKMEKNVEAFAACFAAFDRGRLVAIYPEGTTHAEARVLRIRTGAARIALDYEAAAPGRLVLVPVGLTFEARKSFRGRVLVSFGEPIAVTPYLGAFRHDPARAVDALITAIQRGMEREVVHIDRIDVTALVRAVDELYRGDLERQLKEERGLSDRGVDHVRLSRAIVDAVDHFRARDPERVEQLWQHIQAYRAHLHAHRLRDEVVRASVERRPRRRKIVTSWQAIVGLPVFLYGAAVNALPYFLPRWTARRLARKETDYATIRLLASVVALPVFWSLETWLAWRAVGLAWAAAFAATLPLSGVIAYRYVVGAGRLQRQVRFAVLTATQGQEARRLLVERRALLAELERATADYLTATKGSTF
jgi:glycerol-3-phosphate O-acyltransferase / dihydroxyacetone phosphate acyltransferase